MIHAAYVIICTLSKARRGSNKNFGHHDFQIDLAINLMTYGIRCEWDGVSKEKPSFMPNWHLVPCECNKCFFCVKGLTNSIIHRPSNKAIVFVEYACGTWATTNKSTSKRVNLGMLSGSYCWMCYCKQVTM